MLREDPVQNSTVRTALLLVFSLLAGGSARLGAQEARERSSAPLVKIVVVEGEGALNNIGLRQAKDPTVRVEDDDARPLAGATVTFIVPNMGAGGTFGDRGNTLTVTTDEKGLATGRSLRPNNIAGQFQIRVTASYRGSRASAVINQTNAAPRRVAAKHSNKMLIIILAAAGGGGAAAALALRGGGSSSQTPSVTTVVPGSPVFGPPH